MKILQNVSRRAYLFAFSLVIALITSGCVTTQPGANGSTLVRVSIADALGLKSATLVPATSTAVQTTQNSATVPALTSASMAPSIRATALAGIFAKKPYDGTPKTYFPRVGVTVTDWSRNDCWTAIAKIWWNKTKSESVPAFSVCRGTSLGFSLNNAANLHLFMGQTAMEHSGNVRTDGPKPPMLAVTDHPPIAYSQQESYSGFIEQLALDTGWQAGAPTNIWLVAFSKSEPVVVPTGKMDVRAKKSK
jgi:hypothetical protein